MKRTADALQIAFTYIGTVVGAGFATGQELVQFFTKYGTVALATIAAATALFIWIGMKTMLLAHDIGARSYEDVNRFLFGKRWGATLSFLLLAELLSVSVVMLAGAGSVFREQLGLSFFLGAAATLLFAYAVVRGGLRGILAVNSAVAPAMLLFSGIVLFEIFRDGSPAPLDLLHQPDPYPPGRAWIAPLLYAAFNLTAAQAVLAPLGAAADRGAVKLGAALGGAGLGVLLLAGHLALSAHAPDIFRYDIPMGYVVSRLGPAVHVLYVLLIYAEICTTFISDVYGASLQLEQRLGIPSAAAAAGILALCFAFCFIGFKPLLATLYPLFGALSLVWFAAVAVRGRRV